MTTDLKVEASSSFDLSKMSIDCTFGVYGDDLITLRVEEGMFELEQTMLSSRQNEFGDLGMPNITERLWGLVETFSPEDERILEVRIGGRREWLAPVGQDGSITVLRDGTVNLKGRVERKM